MVLSQFTGSEVIPAVHKIAVLRANAVGDYIFTLPAMQALRFAYPQAEIVLVGRDWHRDFLNGRPGPFNRVVAIPDENILRGCPMKESARYATDLFLDKMAAEGFDLALQLYGGGRYSNSFLLRFESRYTAGLKTPDAAALDRWIPYQYFQNEIIRFLEVVALVGARPVDLEPHFELIPSDFKEAQPYQADKYQPLVAIQPGAGDPRRRWPVEKFAAVGDALVREGVRVIVTGADADEPLVYGVIGAMEEEATAAFNTLSLGGLGALFTQCAVVIGNDTGPIHLAAAVGAATVPIFWCPNLLNSAPFTRTKHRPVVSWQVDCPECGTNTLREPCNHPVSFVSMITVEEVLENARYLIRQKTG